jgi:hypothetical protein
MLWCEFGPALGPDLLRRSRAKRAKFLEKGAGFGFRDRVAQGVGSERAGARSTGRPFIFADYGFEQARAVLVFELG